MLFHFQSKAAADFFMLSEHASLVFKAMAMPEAHTILPQGVIPAERIAQHLASLENALQVKPEQNCDNESKDSKIGDDTSGDDKNDEKALDLPVGFAQRAFPMLDMLRRAQKKDVGMSWGLP